MPILVKVPPLRPGMVFTDKNGNITKDAYDFLFAIFRRVGGSLSSLDAASLLNANWSNPNPIGDATASTGKFTTLQANTVQATAGFACNGMLPQTSYTVGTPVATTAATNTTPYGFTTAAQANDIVAKLNLIITALKNNGIIV